MTELRRYRLDLRYDGTGFHGWAKQDGLRTVQGTLENALSKVLRVPITLTVAGRTDAGVHALGQVAHFDLEGAGPIGEEQGDWDRFRDRMNGLLAADYSTLWRPLVDRGLTPRAALVKGESDVVVTSVREVSREFDARFAAQGRKYRYLLTDRPEARNPLRRNEQWWTQYRELNVEVMNAAAALIVGEHDFLSFCRPREGATTIRTLRRLEVTVEGAPSGPVDLGNEHTSQGMRDGRLAIHVEADAFCHSMVRSLVGALVEVGRGGHDLDWISRLVADPSRAHGVPIAPPRGLTLMEVDYPPPSQWATRIHQSRRRRDCDCEER